MRTDGRTDRQADMTKPIVALRILWNVLANRPYSCAQCHDSVRKKEKMLAFKHRNCVHNGI